jgi:hypothetical protein
MAEIVRMKEVAPVIFGVLKITWADDFSGIVDLRPVFAKGKAFAFLRRDPTRFGKVRLSDIGHKIYWLDDEEDEIDFGAESLRDRAERQAKLLLQAS